MLGPPGAGKGTQAERLARDARAAEDLDRRHPARGGAGRAPSSGARRKATMEAGNLVGDDVMIGIVQERLDRDDARGGFVLDGFPRTVVQADGARRMVDGRGPLVVLDIVVPEDVLVRRLATRRICSKCGVERGAGLDGASARSAAARSITRVDDGVEIVRERLKVYLRQTKPLVEYYSARPTFRVDRRQPAARRGDGAVDAALDRRCESAGAERAL